MTPTEPVGQLVDAPEPPLSWRWRLACTLTYVAGTFAATGRRISLLALIVWWLGGLALAWWTGIGYATQTEEEDVD